MRAYGHRRSLVLLTIALVAMAHLPAASGATPAERCAVAKLRAAANKNAAKLGCHRRALAEGRDVDQACLAAAEAKFSDRFSRIEARGGCATVSDTALVEGAVDACVDRLASLLPAGPTTTTTTTSTTTTSTTSPLCATITTTTTTTTTTTLSGGTTTTSPPNGICSNIGGSCGQCGNGQCVEPNPGIPIGACVVPVPLAPCPAGQSDCGPNDVCVSEGGGSFHCYAFCY